MTSFFSNPATWVLHRFARLVDGPLTVDSEVCYQATQYEPEILCKDLPSWLHILNVATWHPMGQWRHALEWTSCLVGSVTMFYILLRNFKGTTLRKGWARRPMFLPYFGAALYHVRYYKYYLPLPQRGWGTTPCHFGWIVRLVMHIVPMPEFMHDLIGHALVSFTSLAFLFIFEDGEVGDAMYDGVYTWSLVHHVLLISQPLYDIGVGRTAVLPPPVAGKKQKSVFKYFVKWHIISVAVYLFMYVVLCTPISLMSGVNWGWTIHFHSTKVAEDIHLTGPNFRLWWFLYYNILFVIFRLFWLTYDVLIRELGLSPFSVRAQQKAAAGSDPASSVDLTKDE